MVTAIQHTGVGPGLAAHGVAVLLPRRAHPDVRRADEAQIGARAPAAPPP